MSDGPAKGNRGGPDAPGRFLRSSCSATNGRREARPTRPGGSAEAPEHHGSRSERALAELDQVLSDLDQTSADLDQTSADSDQASADSDQVASDRDQAASDLDVAAGADPDVHDRTREIREHTTYERERTAQSRLHAADVREALARSRDLNAAARDRAAEARDRATEMFESAAEPAVGVRAVSGAEMAQRIAAHRARAAQQRKHAAEQRALAAADRHAAARDREEAAEERARVIAELEALAMQLAIAETDQLTGARTRSAGLVDLDHELDRCRRTNVGLVVAYADVVGLKALNDSEGHGAGDSLLQRVVALMRAHVRSYDLIIRLGGDEFLCVMSQMPVCEARERFASLGAALADAPGSHGITCGFAELRVDDVAEELIARADAELISRRRAEPATRLR